MPATAPTVDSLYRSAVGFAHSALDAHHAGDQRRVALDAGTALEHLTKACLAQRHPVLLTELKTGVNNWASLLLLAGVPEGKPKQLRTVGLREALARARTFFTSPAPDADLALLVDLRDGVVHAAGDEAVEERLVVAFIQQTDASLVDLGKDRADFWADQLNVVDALLAEMTDKVAHRVRVKLAAGKAAFERKFGELPKEVREAISRTSQILGPEEDAWACPACGSEGTATGTQDVDWDVDWDEDGIASVGGTVWITPTSYACGPCGLRLDSPTELAAAGLPDRWEMAGVNPEDYEALDWDAYEAARAAAMEDEAADY